MQKYKDLDGVSGVEEYSIGEDFIDVKFKSTKIYRYSYKSAGVDKVEHMKVLAMEGRGLNAYINRYAKDDFER